MQQTGKSFSKWLTLPIVAGLAFAGKKAADFESQLSSLGSVSGASARQMAQFKKQAMDAGAATKFSALEAAQAQTELAKGGLSVQQIMGGGLKAALALAAAGELELGDAAAYTVNAMKQFKLEGRDSMRVADALATAANITTADVQDFGAALVQGGSAARAAGLSFNDTVTILEALAEVGVKNSDAGTSMKTALLQLIGPTRKQQEAARAAGLSFIAQNGEMKSAVEISRMLRTQTEGMTKAQRTQLFQTLAGTDGFRTLLALYDAGPAKLTKFAEANERQGSAAAVAAKKQDNLKGQLEQLGGSVETMAISVGSALLPVLTDLAQTATPIVNDLAQAFSSLPPGVQQGALAFLALGAAVGPAVFLFGTLARGAGMVLGPLMRLGGAARDVSLAFRAGGVGFAASTFASMIGPAGAAVVAVGSLATIIAVLASHESDEEAAARRVTAAKQAQAAAVRDLTAAEREAAGASLDAEQADLSLAQARENRRAALRQFGRDSTEYRQAVLAEKQAILSAAGAHRAQDQAMGRVNRARAQLVRGTNDAVNAARRELVEADRVLKVRRRANSERSPEVRSALERASRAQRQYNDAVAAFQQRQERANVSAINFLRLQRGGDQILRRNRAGFVALNSVIGQLPERKRIRLLTDDQDTAAKLGSASARLRALTSQRHVTKILANSKNAEDALARVQAELARIRDKHITIRATWSIPPAPNLRAPGNRGGSGGRGPGARTSRARSASFADQDVFNAGQGVEAAEAAREALQRGFDEADARRRGSALVRRTDPGRLRGKRGDERRRIQEDIEQATRELREFNQEADRAWRLSQIDVRVTGAEQIRRAREAIAGIRDQLRQLAEDATSREREKREKGIDDALKAELSAIDQSAAAQELRGLQETQRQDARTREDADQARARDEARAKLERAQRSGSARLIAAAQAELTEAERAIADTARDRRIEELEAGLDAKRTEAEGRADIARDGLDAEMAAYQAMLDGQLQALTANLGQQAGAYAAFVEQVRAILAPLGITFDGSAQQQAEIEPTPPTRPRRPRRRRPRRRASGGFVHEAFTLVGEQGPELARLPGGTRVYTARQTQRMLDQEPSGGGMIAPHFHFHGRGPTAGQVIDKLGFMAERL